VAKLTKTITSHTLLIHLPHICYKVEKAILPFDFIEDELAIAIY